jgi:hypothetical protein
MKDPFAGVVYITCDFVIEEHFRMEYNLKEHIDCDLIREYFT